jgi:poly-gamma-glutamate capsule biosynthesis protein CapA/YwtB (metallophosphatase superfamily)
MTEITVHAVGDIILDEPDPDSFFEPSRAVLRTADVGIGHIEVPHSTTTTQTSTDVPAPPADPAALAAVANAGLSVVTLAGNHIADAGPEGVLDTVAHAQRYGLRTSGAGGSLDAARAPALITSNGVTVATLSYNCVGPRESWATSRKPGCAYVHILTHYELDHASPGGPPSVYTFADPASLDRLAADVRGAGNQADVVIVALHKGIGHTPAALAMYESPVSRAAIDAGADAVIGHHAHIMRGIEMYRGSPIYHGLGNFVTVTRALTPTGNSSPEREAWARRREQLFGFRPDPTMPVYPFHPESRNTVIAVLRATRDSVRPGLIPCWIDNQARPVPVTRHDGGQRVLDYVEDITRRAGFTTRFEWIDDQVVSVTEGGVT